MVLFQSLKKKTFKHDMLFVAIMLISLFGVYAGLADGDFYWQADLGRAVIQEGDFNHIYDQVWGTLDVERYLDHEWLCNILFYFLSRIQYRPIFFAKLLFCIISGLGFIWWISDEDYEPTAIKSLLILACICVYSTVFLKIKSYVVSVVFLMIEIRLLQQFYRSFKFKDGVKLLILLVLWNNFHSGSIPLFFVVAGCFWLFGKCKGKVLLYALACVAALGITPYGYELILFDLQHFFDPVMKQIVMDWRPIDTNTALGVVSLAMIVLYVFSLFFNHKFDRPLVLLSLIIAFMSFGSARHLIYLFPMLISSICSMDIKDYELNIELPASLMSGVFAAIVILHIGVGDGYDWLYRMDYIDDELEQIVLDTDTEDSVGLYTSTYYAMSEGDVKSFVSGAFPLTRMRSVAAVMLESYAGVEQVQQIIDYYDLERFLIAKYNSEVEFMNVYTPLYEFLDCNEEYEKLYDNGFMCYFVRK